VLRRVVDGLGRAVRWLASGRTVERPRAWEHCPICDRSLVGPWPAGTGPIGGPSGVGDWIPPTREELIAKCPEHGRPPYNVDTR